MENKPNKMLLQFAGIFMIFTIVTIVSSGLVTYYAQMDFYKQLKCDSIHDVSKYLADVIKADPDDFRDYTQFYKTHYQDMRIPYDFTNYSDAYREFSDAFVTAYPGLALHEDIQPNELSEDLQMLYYTYRHEYWLLTFEQARESFDLPYTYFLTMDENTYYATYQIDGERTEDPEHPGYLYMGDSYYEDPETRQLLWETWYTGEEQNDVFEWDNEWGNTYSYFMPLVIDGEKIGLVIADVEVTKVSESILMNTYSLIGRLALVMILFVILLVLMINKKYISRINYLSYRIENHSGILKSELAKEIRENANGDDEIGMLANETADMLDDLEQHELEVERAARMKTDFLANMSHEIRTPMNAVIGMAEMTLRENIPDVARGYIAQIKSSGRALLTIINDILDFSKIESGKMEILPVEYEPLSMFNDVISIVMTRLEDKNVDLDLDIDPDMPYKLLGDNIRIRQILINLANNAAKFTEKGHITIRAGSERIDDKTMKMKISIEDTGIGIKENDLNKIFDSFSQVDSKRNRNVEGTGLGLAISQRLVQLMHGGTLHVESEYGKGSRFWFEIPQEIVDPAPGMSLRQDEKPVALYILADEFQSECFERDTQRLGIPAERLKNLFSLKEDCMNVLEKHPGCHLYVFIDSRYMAPAHMAFIADEPDISAVLVMNYTSRLNLNLPGTLMIRKPISAMNLTMLFNREKVLVASGKGNDDVDFIAPEATVLIVDDNAVNLTIAEGLLAPLQMSVMTAISGMEAVKMTAENTYDIVFMDHMMPEMDGVEAMHAIRNDNPAYKDIPIIALTANAIGEARELLMSEGMDDFIAKPIEVHNLLSKVKEWLPKDKIKSLTKDEIEARRQEESEDELVIGDLDIDASVQMLGSKKMFLQVLKEYYRVMDKKNETVRTHMSNQNWPGYTIEVHALKSTSRQIGAGQLADMAAGLEAAGKSGDIEFIEAHTDEMLNKYMSYKPLLAPYCEEEEQDDADKPAAEKETLEGIFAQIKEAADNLDFDTLGSCVQTMAGYSYPDDQKELFTRIKEASENLDPDTCVEIVSKWEQLI